MARFLNTLAGGTVNQFHLSPAKLEDNTMTRRTQRVHCVFRVIVLSFFQWLNGSMGQSLRIFFTSILGLGYYQDSSIGKEIR
jgi:hypothetical protein